MPSFKFECMRMFVRACAPCFWLCSVRSHFFLARRLRDWIADPDDVAQLVEELRPSGCVVAAKAYADVSHLDFTWGSDMGATIYADVVEQLARHHPARQ